MEYKVVAFEKNKKYWPPMRMAVATSSRPTSRAFMPQRLKLAKPDDHVVLPEIISKEPLGPLVRQGDDAWFNVVKWTYYAC